MIKNDIDDDPRKTFSRRMEEFLGLEKDRVIVGETINGAVEDDPPNDLRGETFKETFRSSPCEIPQQGAHPGGVGVLGQVKMGEEVQSL